ncbi:MAG: hypothetical protein ACOX9B_00550 [Candidatus Xenobium sp.]|jgi:hypothetical protein|nr:hypothetical protein [Burkholderiales bacterium]
MLPGPNLLKACPHCSQQFLMPTLTSGNTFGAIQYSDGKTVAPMLPEMPRFHLCRDCGKPFWIREAPELGRTDELSGELPPDIQTARLPSVDDYLEALQKGLARGKEEELTLRLGWWWAVNDPERDLPAQKDPPPRPEGWEVELNRLSDLLDREDPTHRLFLGEMARQQGRFEEAVQILSESVPEDLQPAVQSLLALVEKNSRRVEPLSLKK